MGFDRNLLFPLMQKLNLYCGPWVAFSALDYLNHALKIQTY